MMRTRRLLVAGSTVLLLLAACSSGNDGAGSSTESAAGETTAASETEEPSETPEPSETDEPTETEGPSGETEVEAEDSSLGTILTDSDGNTLYVFLADTGGESTCYEDCADTWPALEAPGELKAGDGVEASLLDTTERTDGTLQVTYNGMPLYYFANDQQPGDTNGQGIGEVWYVVSPGGDPIQG